MAEYQAELRATREKTARLRAMRLARDAANQKTPPINQKGSTASLRSQSPDATVTNCHGRDDRQTTHTAGLQGAAVTLQ
jgi:hypothetical protein